MNKDDAEEYTQSLGQIVAGSWRQIALAKRLGVPKALGLNTEDWVKKELGGYVKMSIPDRREAVAELTGEGLSTREVAKVLGASKSSVARDLSVQNGTEESSDAVTDKGAECTDVPDGTEPIDAVAALAADDKTSYHNHRVQGSGYNEWYTPSQYIQAARAVMGGIDLDPASSDKAQKLIQATTYFTADNSGLDQEWYGRVWLNPPYSRDLIGEFIDRLVNEYQAGRISQAICLTHNYTDTVWFHTAESVATCICFTLGRIAFEDQKSNRCSPTQGQAFFYLGNDRDRFVEQFRLYGFIR